MPAQKQKQKRYRHIYTYIYMYIYTHRESLVHNHEPRAKALGNDQFSASDGNNTHKECVLSIPNSTQRVGCIVNGTVAT